MQRKCLLPVLLALLMLLTGCRSQAQPAQIAATTLPVYEFTSRLCEGTPPQVFSCRCHINSPSRKKKGLILFKVGQNFVQPLQDNSCYSQLMLFGIIADTLIQGILHPNAQGFLFCIFGFWSSHLCHSCSHTSTAPVYFPCDRKSSCKKPFLKIFTKNRKFTLCSLTFRP